MKSASDVIIIGGGIIGCSIAYQLAKRGIQVTLVEKGRPGEEASTAAAGMLAPQSEAAHGLSGSFSDLCFASRRLYPDFIAELEEEEGVKIGYGTAGSIFVATDYAEAATLAGLLERQQKAGRPAEELTAKQVRELEPALAESIQVGVYLPEDHCVDNRVLMPVLIEAAARRGARFLTGTPVLGVEIQGEKVIGVCVPDRMLSAGMVINAAGAWAGMIHQGDGVRVPVRPIRGQMVRLEVRPQPLRHLIHSAGCYIVPWPDGRVLIGATVENVGYRKDVTARGVQQLLNAAMKIVPSVESAPIRDMWAGLRPDTPDNLPILGTGEISNLLLATGHFRNGILLAPITAQLITELVVNGEPSVSIEPYGLSRFEQVDKNFA